MYLPLFYYRVSKSCPRLLINMEKAGQVTILTHHHVTFDLTLLGLLIYSTVCFSLQANPLFGLLGFGGGMDFDSDKAYRYYRANYI